METVRKSGFQTKKAMKLAMYQHVKVRVKVHGLREDVKLTSVPEAALRQQSRNRPTRISAGCYYSRILAPR